MDSYFRQGDMQALRICVYWYVNMCVQTFSNIYKSSHSLQKMSRIEGKKTKKQAELDGKWKMWLSVQNEN